MSFTLCPDDRRAVDLVMDHAFNGRFYAWGNRVHGSTLQFERRVERINTLLHVLSWMPACEPPGDLVERTVAHVQAAVMLQPTPANVGFTHLNGH